MLFDDESDRAGSSRGSRPLVGVGTGIRRWPARRRSPPGGDSWRRWPPAGRASSSSRTSTGPTPRCSSSSSTCSTGAHRYRLCSSAPLGPSSSTRSRSWGGGKRNATTISLSPLSDEEAARLFHALLERTLLPAETQTALLERAGGNPLYAEQFARMLEERGAVEGLAIPETVQALLAARLDTLAPELKELLQDASVVGRVFWSGALAAIGRRERDDGSASAERARPPRVRAADPRLVARGRGRVLLLACDRPRRRLPADPALAARGQAPCGRALGRRDRRGAGRGSRGDPRAPLRPGPRASPRPPASHDRSSRRTSFASSCSQAIAPPSSTPRPRRRTSAERSSSPSEMRSLERTCLPGSGPS